MLYNIDNEVIYFIISILIVIVIYDHNSAVPKL